MEGKARSIMCRQSEILLRTLFGDEARLSVATLQQFGNGNLCDLRKAIY